MTNSSGTGKHSGSDGVQGADEQRTEPYMKYGERVAEAANGAPTKPVSWGKAQQSAESASSAAGFAGRQAGAARMFALVDCNNFFVSCERLFRPDLTGKPVVVLSSNDGCAVARSNEAKALGIPMGAPAFKFRELFQRHGVVTFSANFELYGDISQRITATLSRLTPRIEVYSVDESFIDLSALPIASPAAWGRQLAQTIQRDIGVPVSVGMAPSKTLCKLAADRAKKRPELAGALVLDNLASQATYLAQTPVEDIWGIGRRLAPKLRAEGLHTALDLSQISPRYAQQLMGIRGRQLVAELTGVSCLPMQTTAKPQQMIARGRQFGEDTGDLGTVEAAIANLTARAAYHLRRDGQLAHTIGVRLATNRNKPGYRQIITTVRLPAPTADTGQLCSQLMQALQADFNPRLKYHKAEVHLFDLTPASAFQTDLLGQADPSRADASQRRMQVLDTVNRRYGAGSLRYAAEDISQAWRPRRGRASPRYTTDWTELATAWLQ